MQINFFVLHGSIINTFLTNMLVSACAARKCVPVRPRYTDKSFTNTHRSCNQRIGIKTSVGGLTRMDELI